MERSLLPPCDRCHSCTSGKGLLEDRLQDLDIHNLYCWEFTDQYPEFPKAFLSQFYRIELADCRDALKARAVFAKPSTNMRRDQDIVEAAMKKTAFAFHELLDTGRSKLRAEMTENQKRQAQTEAEIQSLENQLEKAVEQQKSECENLEKNLVQKTARIEDLQRLLDDSVKQHNSDRSQAEARVHSLQEQLEKSAEEQISGNLQAAAQVESCQRQLAQAQTENKSLTRRLGDALQERDRKLTTAAAEIADLKTQMRKVLESEGQASSLIHSGGQVEEDGTLLKIRDMALASPGHVGSVSNILNIETLSMPYHWLVSQTRPTWNGSPLLNCESLQRSGFPWKELLVYQNGQLLIDCPDSGRVLIVVTRDDKTYNTGAIYPLLKRLDDNVRYMGSYRVLNLRMGLRPKMERDLSIEHKQVLALGIINGDCGQDYLVNRKFQLNGKTQMDNVRQLLPYFGNEHAGSLALHLKMIVLRREDFNRKQFAACVATLEHLQTSQCPMSASMEMDSHRSNQALSKRAWEIGGDGPIKRLKVNGEEKCKVENVV
ncbi:hypothetical protein PVAG01_09394 [Phlyctema vagabunda]|uniref:Uncharacterized protein n=1 Tax=Phlyctema vagabunda TaxID=108571 RepID=A0ABR4P7D6_9HELO